MDARDKHLISKALAVSILVIEELQIPEMASDLQEMKMLLDKLAGDDGLAVIQAWAREAVKRK